MRPHKLISFPPYFGGRTIGVSATVLRARVLLGGLLLELERHEPLVANNRGLMAGLDHIHLPGRELDRGAVLVVHAKMPGPHHADVADLTAVGARHWLDALGPYPSGLHLKARDGG